MARLVAERSDVLPLLGELFREHGFEGTSLALITQRTRLGKGSLYHFFPGGKEEMAAAVLADIDGWFEREIYAPLREGEPAASLAAMFANVDRYFRSGRRSCLLGAFALGVTRGRFAVTIDGYFRRWQEALASALRRNGHSGEAMELAEEVLVGIQGALVLAHARQDEGVFQRELGRLRRRCGVSVQSV
ncbi:TetR/AcrR family transcriptional regulator [Ancylobacter dichloromethanicus]|uniref:TetR family transcriptional regulator n=1 Tax=Ancylobacter dichloromethanicus TaxID=518825 RepID=A0A9W6MZU0_9HYPH|nr:TetR/AcrR family transcriptional regulator [Ancylobacter dichloromethanicus]MBS7553321.1 TetR/AcrR family transcriptional regulator [Ancylobacter dichloromethanicus]GLK73104.1 TetR family transcriptional regulator [Ancylobacter dichloromethanicus]